MRERGFRGEGYTWHKKFTVIANCHARFQLKSPANWSPSCHNLPSQLAVLPHKIERTANFCHLHLAVPPSRKSRTGVGAALHNGGLYGCTANGRVTDHAPTHKYISRCRGGFQTDNGRTYLQHRQDKYISRCRGGFQTLPPQINNGRPCLTPPLYRCARNEPSLMEATCSHFAPSREGGEGRGLLCLAIT